MLGKDFASLRKYPFGKRISEVGIIGQVLGQPGKVWLVELVIAKGQKTKAVGDVEVAFDAFDERVSWMRSFFQVVFIIKPGLDGFLRNPVCTPFITEDMAPTSTSCNSAIRVDKQTV